MSNLDDIQAKLCAALPQEVTLPSGLVYECIGVVLGSHAEKTVDHVGSQGLLCMRLLLGKEIKEPTV